MPLTAAILARVLAPGDALIETGTNEGDGVAAALAAGAAYVWSCETDGTRVAVARARFRGNGKVSIQHGRSTDLLPAALGGGRAPLVVWLDAHDPFGSPVLDELAAVARAGAKPKAILVDDVRYFRKAIWGFGVNDVIKAIAAVGPYRIRYEDTPGAKAVRERDLLVAERA